MMALGQKKHIGVIREMICDSSSVCGSAMPYRTACALLLSPRVVAGLERVEHPTDIAIVLI
jgi:hypothetical protein